MKIILSVFLLCAFLLTQAQDIEPDENFHVYLLIGQSNMAGRGQLDSLSNKVNPQILMLDKENQWVAATDPVHFDKPAYVGVGPAISFAESMLDSTENIKIGLIPCAHGGSPIRAWETGASYFDNHPYDDAIKRAKIAMQRGVLKGILWHQGESDNDPKRAALYLDKIEALVQNLRRDLNAPDLPFVAGEIGHFNKKDHINEIINQLPQELPHTAVVSAEGLKDKGDRLHFSTGAARELGKRYARAIKCLQNPESPSLNRPTVVLTFDDAEISHYTIVAPLLKKFGYNATFFINETAGKSPEDSVHYMNWEQIAELNEMGFEIGNHTGHHKNMTKLTPEEMRQEVSYIEKKCEEYRIPKPVSFAYPGNRSDSLSRQVLHELGYPFARAGGSKYFDPQKEGQGILPSFTMGSTEKLEARTWKALKNLKPGQVLIFTIHGVPDIPDPGYTTSEESFAQFLQYMKDHHIKVIAMRDLKKFEE